MITAFDGTDDKKDSIISNLYLDNACTMLFEVKVSRTCNLPHIVFESSSCINLFDPFSQSFSGFGAPGTCVQGNAIINGVSDPAYFAMASVATCPISSDGILKKALQKVCEHLLHNT